MTERWLSIVGIGEDGRAGLSSAAIALVEGAELVIGSKRHLDLFGATRGEQRVWSQPLEATIGDITARRGRPVAILASGDPFWYGAGVTLARHIPANEMLAVPSPSSFSLAAARLGWALQETTTIGLNMPAHTPLIRRHLHHGRKILALSLNAETPREVAALLTETGFGETRVTVLEALGGQREKIRTEKAADFSLRDVDALNIIAVDVVAGANARSIAFAPGLPDDLFETDGQLTKREVRAVTISSLAPQPGQLLWDIGLGSGSVAIEWLLAHSQNRAIGIEKDAVRAARAMRNAIALGVPHLECRQGSAPEALRDLPRPDAVFIGGGAHQPATLDLCWTALKPSGRLVVNSVTLETEAALLNAHGSLGGSLIRIGLERADAVGTRTAWRPAMTVMQWVAVKPGAVS